MSRKADPMGLDGHTLASRVKPTRIILIAAQHYADAEHYALTELRADSKTLERGWAGGFAGSTKHSRWRARYVVLPQDRTFVMGLRNTRAQPVELHVLPAAEKHGEWFENLLEVAEARDMKVVREPSS